MAKKSFIVSLAKSSTKDQVEAAAKQAEEKGWTVTNKYTATIKGFSIEKDIPEGEIQASEAQIQSIDGVESFEADGAVSTQ
ncbi:hypothetical protein N0V93_007231 [Gnomoniopsis smithogilvyi]|uniref:Inhibitor I9 domain-containing protein n=1 Tax=Gnomoniopsis smithogilvyi TaxID=1191159 RepID=A0A9W8YQZ0_9PEZI|nr:hypothetical protein N0V93_007231 [Gnomoniopsis smithogilvyi]